MLTQGNMEVPCGAMAPLGDLHAYPGATVGQPGIMEAHHGAVEAHPGTMEALPRTLYAHTQKP
jgi:hypothetical protein